MRGPRLGFIERGAVIDCGRFTVVADKILNPRVELTDETVRARVVAVRKEKEKKK